MGIIERYRKFLPITDKTPLVTLGEGNTPLIRADRLAREIGFNGQLYLKFEGANPTGSFKDRGMVVAVAKAMEEGAKMLLCASTGNTASSAAAYGAAVGLPVAVLLPKGGVAQGKLNQMLAYGAQVLEIESGFDACQDLVRELCKKHPKEIALVNSINPYRLEGQKTAAFEIWEELGSAPDCLFIPVGNAGNITAYWMGFKEYKDYWNKENAEAWNSPHRHRPHGFKPPPIVEHLPKMMGYQAAGAAPIVLGHSVENPETVASAIQVGNPANWQGALAARDESGGKIDSVTDEEILAAYKMIPRLTGIFCEPASAASVAGLDKAIHNGDAENKEGKIVVCVLTGNGLKDQETAGKEFTLLSAKPLKPVLEEVESRLKL